MKIVTACIFVLTAITAVFAQTATFRWNYAGCSYVGTYDKSKISLIELRNTLKLAEPGSYDLATNTTVWKYADIAKLDVLALDREYKTKQAELTILVIAKSQYWEEFRRRKLHEMEQVYKLNRATMLGYKDRKALLAFTDAPGCTTKFAEPLIAGGDSLLTTWRAVNGEARTKNADPERLRRIFDQQFASSDRVNYALLEVMAFGWSNCANESIPYVEYDGTPEKEFEKLFKTVKKLRCGEP